MSWIRSRREPGAAAPSGVRLPFLAPGTIRDDVVAKVAALARAGSLDAGNGDVLDGWLGGLRTKRRAHVLAERTERVAAAQRDVVRLEAAAGVAEQRAESAAAELQHTERMIAVLEKRIVEPAEAEPGERRERRSRPRPTLDPLDGLVRPWFHRIVITVLVLLAAAGDLATFYVTLAGFFTDGGEAVIWLLTSAFAAASVGLMHGFGRALKDLREARGGIGRVALAFMFLGWLALGGVAVFFRWQQPAAASTAPAGFGTGDAVVAHDPRLAAVLLAGLFVASGLLAFYSGFSEHHPRMATYLALRKRLPEQWEEVARRTEVVGDLRQQLAHARDEIDRTDQWAEDALATTDAEIAELEELVRVEVAGHLGLPEATNGLTTGRRSQDPPGPDPVEPGIPAPRPVPTPPAPRDSSTLIRIPRESLPALTARSLNGHSSANGQSPLDGTH